mmetsp:Transcript_19369/g.21545  ORF Transcript_19369/g.21545 Transcript_19369/m.21545 type:complete len:126 (-) Transcript_19369:61-438(-)
MNCTTVQTKANAGYKHFIFKFKCTPFKRSKTANGAGLFLHHSFLLESKHPIRRRMTRRRYQLHRARPQYRQNAERNEFRFDRKAIPPTYRIQDQTPREDTVVVSTQVTTPKRNIERHMDIDYLLN